MSRKYLIPAILAISSGAFAQTPTSITVFADVDTNRDGSISQAELGTAKSNLNLSTADKDKNGSLSQAEFDAAMKANSSKGSAGGSTSGSSTDGSASGKSTP